MPKVKLSWPEAAVVLLVGTLLASVFGLYVQAMRSKDVVLERAIQNAETLVEFAHAAHSQYSQSIADFLQTHRDDFELSATGAQDSLPFPATFTRLLLDTFSETHEGVFFQIFSDDPFEGQRDRTLDPFEQNALAALSPGTLPRFHRMFWNKDGSATVRLATPITMTQKCVDCHNLPRWGLKRTDWRVGDVRGVRQIAMIVPASNLAPPLSLWIFFALVMVACLLGSGVLYPAVRRAVAQRSHFEDISLVLGERARHLARQANTDALTELSNRRFFDNVLHAYVSEYSEAETHLGLILFDIDHFKKVNDLHGHAVGDKVIARIARLTKEHVRRHDCPARVGGEEFAIVCPGGDRDSLLELAERLRRLVAAMQFDAGTGAAPFGVTISLGVAELQLGDDPLELYKRADVQLYRAKGDGRNRVSG